MARSRKFSHAYLVFASLLVCSLGLLGYYRILVVRRSRLGWQGNHTKIETYHNNSNSKPLSPIEKLHTGRVQIETNWSTGEATHGNMKIGIVNTADENYRRKFREHFDSMECYAEVRGYDFISISKPDMFRRHLIVRDVLPRYDWVLFLDGDVQIVNFGRGLEVFVENTTADVIFPMRFINGEIAAASYLIRNTIWSARFLTQWASRSTIPNSQVENADNGFLEQLLTKVIFVDGSHSDSQRREGEKCVEVFNQNLLRGKCCRSELMGAQLQFGHVSFLRRGHGFFRDDFVGIYLFEEDIGVHNKNRWRSRGHGFYRNADGSCKRFSGAIFPDLVLPKGMARYAVCRNDHNFASRAPYGLFSPDVWACFPHCSDGSLSHTVSQCGSKTTNYDAERSVCNQFQHNFTAQDWEFYAKFKPAYEKLR